MCSISSTESQSVTLSAMLLASGIDLSANHYNVSLFSSFLSIPRHPSQSVCQDYSVKCASLIAAARQPSLSPNCDSSVPYSAIKKFQTFSQIVDTVNFPLSPLNILESARSINLTIRSDPNDFTQAFDQGYRTLCPEGTLARTHVLPIMILQPFPIL